jgi:hypothetical protein
MAAKRVTLILHRADRELWEGKGAKLRVTDVNQVPLRILEERRLNAGTSVVLIDLDLHFDTGQVYGISIEVKKHRLAWHLINRRSFIVRQADGEREVEAIILRMLLVPNRAASSDLDRGHDRMMGAGSPMVDAANGISREAYRDFAIPQKMALLNIEAKLRETSLHGVPLLSYVEGVRHVAVDRLFLLMNPELKQVVRAAPEFASAPGHPSPDDAPLPLPAHPDSWKHRAFGAGNLQLSFSAATEAHPTIPGRLIHSVDADIDLARGVGHVFEWLDNNVFQPGKRTEQTHVYALLFSQMIEPYYTLDPLDEDDA